MNELRNSFARAFFVSALAIGCARGAPGADVAIASDAAAAMDATIGASNDAAIGAVNSAGGDAAIADAASAADASGATLEEAFLRAKPLSAKSIGHTSVVFKVKLEGGLEAAYKPRSKRGETRYRGEVAAYRLAQALGLPNVPPAFVRSFDLPSLRAVAGTEPIFEEVLATGDGKVPGALIPWIKGLDFVALEKDPWWTRWHGWLARGGAIPDDQKAMAGQISTMIAFDYITGNWDRWSGGNVGLDATKKTLLYIDNDGAFYDPPPAPALARQLALLQKVDRFSRSFFAALRTLETSGVLGEESPGVPLLSARVLAQVEERRKKVLAIVKEKVAKDGEPETFFFE